MKDKVFHWLSMVISMIHVDVMQFLRQRIVFISSLLTPVSMILSFGLGMNNPSVNNSDISYFSNIVPGIFAISIMFTSTYTIGYGTIMDRQKRLIEDMVLSKYTFYGYITARYISMIIKSFLQFLIVLLLAVLLFNFKISSIFMLLLTFINTTLFFSALGVIIAIYNNEMSFSSVSNFILMPLFYFGGIFFPLENFGSLSEVLKYFPLSIHVILLRYASIGSSTYPIFKNTLLCCLYSLLSIILASILFKKKIKSN